MTTYTALVPEQQQLADLLAAVPKFARRVNLICRRCNEPLGWLADTGITVDGGTHLTQLGSVFQAFQFSERRRAERAAPSLHGKVAVPNMRYPLTSVYVAFIEHSTASNLPDPLPLACERHGATSVAIADLRNELALRRNDDSVGRMHVGAPRALS